MTPPQLHMHFDEFESAGAVPTITVGEPGTQGAAVTGMHGIGVSTPMAAAVAAATWGFDGDVHMPNGGMFSIGLLSMMFAAGGPPPMMRLTGRMFNADGATPKLHIMFAPDETRMPIGQPFFAWSVTMEPVLLASFGNTSTHTMVRSSFLFQLSNDGSR